MMKTEELILKGVLCKHLPELNDFIETTGLVSYGDMLELCGVLKRDHNPEHVLENVATELGALTNKRIAVCPAGGLAEDVLAIVRQTGNTVSGILDSYKADCRNTFLGERLYPLVHLDRLDADAIVLASSAYADALYETIVRSFPSYENKVVHPFIEDAFLNKMEEKPLKAFQNAVLTAAGKPVVLFAVDRFQVNFIKRVRAVKKTGCVTLLISLDKHCTSVTQEHLTSDCFDACYNAGGDMLAFLYMFLNMGGKAVLHLLPIVTNSVLSTLLMALNTSKVVCEFHDLLCTMHTNDSLAGNVGVKRAGKWMAQERFLYTHADVISYKDSPDVLKILEENYQTNRPAIQFQAYCEETVQPGKTLGDPVRIVYSGGVLSQTTSGGSATTSLYDIADMITSQHICFDIYNVYDRQDGTYRNYRKKAEQNPLFSYFPPVPNEFIIKILSDYDFGWNVVDLRFCSIQKTHRETTMSTKLYDYLAAGIPVFVSQELHYMASFVEKHGVGIVLSYEDIHHLSDIIRQCDYERLKHNILCFQESHSLGRQIQRYTKVYSDLMHSSLTS